MAYSLRYWYNNKLTDGKVIRLEIYKKDSTAAAMEIGDVVQGLSLNIDGGEDNIDAPIVSTSLVMTFCDAYDHPEAEVKKCGNYAEFYTPDATLWKVVLLCKDKGSSSFRTLWGGYVTPDSYEEDLTYRGSVTIVARDNIGHMADFPFDAEGDDYGTISFREIIEGAWAKIESPMILVFHDEWMQTEGVSALDTRMNVSAFEDKSWHEAVEAALYAYGAVLRFIGDYQVKVSPLRYMPNYGGSVTQSEPVFMTGATRMLTPAVKRIEETASYELVNYFDKPPTVDDLSGEVYDVNDGMIQTWPLANTSGAGWANPVPSLSPIFNPTAYELLDGFVNDEDKEHIYDDIYILTGSNQNSLTYSKYVHAYNFEVELLLGRIIYAEKNNSQNKLYLASGINAKINYIKYGISIEKNGIQQWLKEDGSWGAGQTEITLTKGDEESLGGLKVALNLPVDVSGVLLFTLHIFEIGSNIAFSGCVALKGVSFSCENTSLLQTNRVNTNYNEENNVIITRDPAIAPAYNTTFLPSVIKNGIFYAEGLAYKPAKAWAFAGDTPQQMAVYNHLQLLAYYAKPNNVIEGSIVNGDVSRFAHIWQFEGKEHILVSGRYNFINGYIEGAILREFARYESLWGSTGGTQLPATETSSETNIEASASSSSSSNTYENKTTVNINLGGDGGSSYLRDLLDVDVTASAAGSVLYFNGAEWVDKSLDVLLTEMSRLGDWFYKTDDGKSIGTKYNLFSEGEMSANGLNLGGGTSGGGGLIQNVLGKSSFGTVASEDNATTFNAYAIDSLYKRIVELEGKDVEVDLSDYYTKQQTQNAITDALSPYIKADDADGKYAALASFNALQSSFDRLYSALNDDTSGVINTWNEVVDFVNEYSGSEDLSTILGKMNTDINARVKVSDFDTWKTDVFNPLSVAVTNLGNKVDTNTANINKLLGWFNVDADGNLFTTYNFYSTKEISANGISQGTGGGGSGLISSVLGATSLGATLTNDNSVVFNAYATNEIYKTTQGHASRIGVLESQVGQLTTQGTKVSVSDLLTTGTKIATITVDGVAHEVKGDFLPLSGGVISGKGLRPFAVETDAAALEIQYKTVNGVKIYLGWLESEGMFLQEGVSANYLGIKTDGTPYFHDGTKHALIHAGNIGSYNAGSADVIAKTYGGSINYAYNDNKVRLIKDTSVDWETNGYPNRYSGGLSAISNYCGWQMVTYGGTTYTNPYFRKVNDNNTWTDWKQLAFTSDLENYMPLTGGTISNGAFNPLTIKGSSSYSGIGFARGSNDAGYLVYAGGVNWHITNEGWGIGHKLVHAGNVGDYNAGSADKLTAGAIADANAGQYTDKALRWFSGIAKEAANFPSFSAYQNGLLALPLHISGTTAQIYITAGNGFYFRGNTNADWKTIAFTDSNVASADVIAKTYANESINYALDSKIRLISNTNSNAVADGFPERWVSGISAVSNYVGWQLVTSAGAAENPFFRSIQDTGKWKPWRKLAFLDDNVASATKLQTARTIWGQSFDGTADVDGHLYLPNSKAIFCEDTSGTIRQLLVFRNDLVIGYGMSEASRNTILLGNNIYFRYGTTSTTGLILNSSGNVGIGTTRDVGIKTVIGKENAVGSMGANTLHNSAMMVGVSNPTNSYGIHFWTEGSGNGFIQQGRSDGEGGLYHLVLQPFGGNVGIGTTSPAYKLDVSGTLRATDAVTFGSTLTVAGATTHNGIAYFGGTTYYINTSGNAHFNAISGSSLQVDSAAFNGTIHSNEYIGNVAKWSITKEGAASFASFFTSSIETGSFLATGDAQIYGSLRLRNGSANYGNALYFGDGSLCYLHEEVDDRLTIYAQKGLVTKAATGTAWDSITKENWIDDNSAHTRFVNNYNALAIIIDKDYGASYRRAAIQVGDTSNNVGTLYLNPKGGEVHVGSTLYVSTINAGSTLYLQASTITNKAGWWTLSATGDFYTLGNIAAEGEISANALNQGSDIRFKHQLGDITLDLDTIANAPMFRFTWTNKENSRVQIGTSAQYWKDSARELVSVDKDDFHRLDYATLGVLIGVTLGKTVKNHEDRIKELETKVESLEAENRRLRYGN